MELRDKIAVVTGGGRGIGRAIALAYAREGADLVLASRSKEALEETRAMVEALGRKALVVPTDILQEESVRNLEEQATSTFGHTDILVCPKVLVACSSRLRTLSSWRMSVGTTSAFRPSASTIARVSSSASFERDASTRSAPSLAYARAIARPIPRPPPVTTAILSRSSIRNFLLFIDFYEAACACATHHTIFSVVIGNSSIFTPKGLTASSTARVTAGGATMRPPSPPPLTP